ncbi:MAG: hypothetical protein J6S78_01620 [Lachnospiraceae bacterium]|nr:hypothetical protein [Lachnospiraceae bacterium]
MGGTYCGCIDLCCGIFHCLAGKKSIMDLVENAWGAFGTAFGPTILLSLYLRKK